MHDAKYGEITGEKAVAFYKLFGYDADKEGIAYDDYGHAYINATMITTGALTVGNTDNPIFSADWGGDQKVDENGNPMTDNNGQPIMKEPACTIGGWYVDKNVISDGNSDDKFGTVGIYSGGTDEKFTMSSLIPDGGI